MRYGTKYMLSVVILTFSCIAAVFADEQKGLSIAKEMKARVQGFNNYSVDMKMVLISVSGQETLRELHVITREVDGDGEQSLAVFDSPADVKGTGFLSHTHRRRDDDQWLYLPALKRVKRIAPQNKTAPFMGSEFSYEDLASYEVEKYTYNYINEEKLGTNDCFVLERFPVNARSGYSRQRVWVEKKRYLALKIDYYNMKDEFEKTLTASGFKKYLDHYWFASAMHMQNHLSKKASRLYWYNYTFRQPLRDSDFNPNSLSRVR